VQEQKARRSSIYRLFSEAKRADVAQLVEQLIRNSREGFCTGFHRLAHRCRRGCFSHFRFALRFAELRYLTPKRLANVENDREPSLARGRGVVQRSDGSKVSRLGLYARGPCSPSQLGPVGAE
jgi:hypothetical protein